VEPLLAVVLLASTLPIAFASAKGMLTVILRLMSGNQAQ
jgi:hypothetical protein